MSEFCLGFLLYQGPAMLTNILQGKNIYQSISFYIMHMILKYTTPKFKQIFQKKFTNYREIKKTIKTRRFA